MRRVLAGAVALLLVSPQHVAAQAISHRGFIQGRAVTYPQGSAPDERHTVFEATLRYEPTVRLASWLRVFGGVDAGADSWNQTDRRVQPGFRDRGLRRPALSIRRLSVSISHGALTVDLGKQLVRWGKTDILVPTDRFAPRDYLEVTDNDVLGVTGARVLYEKSGNIVDVVWLPWFTPSRLPLRGTRWAPVPELPARRPIGPLCGVLQESCSPCDTGQRRIAVLGAHGAPARERRGAEGSPRATEPGCGAEPHVRSPQPDFPRDAQLGLRWSHVGDVSEFSVSLYDGFNHLPLVGSTVAVDPFHVELVRTYPRLRLYGGDAAVAVRWVTLKAEVGYFSSPDRRADEYVLYVIQLERQAGEWSFVGGYAGEAIVDARTAFSFAPDRGLTRTFLGRAAYTIHPNRSVTFEGAQRENGDGTWARAEYSQAVGAHWRVTVAGTVLAGADDDFLGQYHRNSHLSLTLRYSF